MASYSSHQEEHAQLFSCMTSKKRSSFLPRFNINMLLAVALGVSAVCIIAIPLCRIYGFMLILAGIYGGCFGATDTFTTVQLIRMYGKQVTRENFSTAQQKLQTPFFLPSKVHIFLVIFCNPCYQVFLVAYFEQFISKIASRI